MPTMNANTSRRQWMGVLTVLIALVGVAAEPRVVQTQAGSITDVLLVTMDGMRWQEVFGGMQSALLTKEDGGVSEAAPIARRFDADTPEARRQKLMPFFWDVV